MKCQYVPTEGKFRIQNTQIDAERDPRLRFSSAMRHISCQQVDKFNHLIEMSALFKFKLQKIQCELVF